MIFLTILGVTEILCSIRLDLEKKTGKGIPESSSLEFLENFSANNFALSDAKVNTSRPLNRGGGIADLPLLRTLLAILQKFLGSDGLFCFISICKFGSFKNPFAMITKFSELQFRFRRFIILAQTKQVNCGNWLPVLRLTRQTSQK